MVTALSKNTWTTFIGSIPTMYHLYHLKHDRLVVERTREWTKNIVDKGKDIVKYIQVHNVLS